jgi:hypothetical protein
MQVIVHNSLVLAYQCAAIPAVDRVVSQSESVAKGHDFSRADQGKNITGALAPASVFGMKVSDRRKAACQEMHECGERIRLHTEMSQFLAEWLAASGDLQQSSRSDSSRQSKVEEVKRSKAKLNAAQSRYSIHVREHGCWKLASSQIMNKSK